MTIGQIDTFDGKIIALKKRKEMKIRYKYVV
jgi:hypothetical protein